MQEDEYGIIYLNYGRILYKQGKVKDANGVSGRGLLRFPNNSNLWTLKAISTYRLGDKQKALEEIQKAKSISADPRIDQFYLGILNDNLVY